jgi:hypothetical protein
MLTAIDAFASKFSPQSDTNDIFIEIINAFALIVGVGSAGAWNKRTHTSPDSVYAH